ncbi:MAG TPA: CoA transferase [Myxococcota bacterium]|nr:CoA transferase [Myxococcota bacterium]
MRPILEGIRVLDVGSFVFGPAAATVMADFGADVVKVEPPKTGDPYRYLHQMPPLPKCAEDYCWLLTGRGKRSVALDLKDAEAREILLRLVREADVFVTNYPLRVLADLRLAWHDLEPLNPRLVFAHATGFGEEGPEAEKPGYDATAWWARSGLQDAVRPRGGLPALSVAGMGDHPSAMALFGAIMLALYQRERTGRGSKVGSSLLANGIWSNGIFVQAMLCGAEGFRHVDCREPDNALVNQYETRDGEWILLAMVQEDKLWPGLCRALERPELMEDPRFASRVERRACARELYAIIAPLFASRDLAHWRKALDEEAVTFTHVAKLDSLVHDPQLEAAGILRDGCDSQGHAVRSIASPITVEGSARVETRPPPAIGQHTDEVLAGLGYDEAARAALRNRGAIR